VAPESVNKSKRARRIMCGSRRLQRPATRETHVSSASRCRSPSLLPAPTDLPPVCQGPHGPWMASASTICGIATPKSAGVNLSGGFSFQHENGSIEQVEVRRACTSGMGSLCAQTGRSAGRTDVSDADMLPESLMPQIVRFQSICFWAGTIARCPGSTGWQVCSQSRSGNFE
jgi:hypothetical protein